MTNFRGMQQRMFSKIYLNKMSIVNNRYNDIDLQFCELKIQYGKEQKRLIDVFEVLTILEQISMQKPQIKFEKILEVSEKIKLKNVEISVKVNNKNSIEFFWYFMLILLADRKKRNFTESNFINLKARTINFAYYNLKAFRRLLLSDVSNMLNYLQIKFKFLGNSQILNLYKLYSFIKFSLCNKINKKYGNRKK